MEFLACFLKLWQDILMLWNYMEKKKKDLEEKVGISYWMDLMSSCFDRNIMMLKSNKIFEELWWI